MLSEESKKRKRIWTEYDAKIADYRLEWERQWEAKRMKFEEKRTDPDDPFEDIRLRGERVDALISAVFQRNEKIQGMQQERDFKIRKLGGTRASSVEIVFLDERPLLPWSVGGEGRRFPRAGDSRDSSVELVTPAGGQNTFNAPPNPLVQPVSLEEVGPAAVGVSITARFACHLPPLDGT